MCGHSKRYYPFSGPLEVNNIANRVTSAPKRMYPNNTWIISNMCPKYDPGCAYMSPNPNVVIVTIEKYIARTGTI